MSGVTMQAIVRRRQGTPDLLSYDTADALRLVGEGRALGQTVIRV